MRATERERNGEKMLKGIMGCGGDRLAMVTGDVSDARVHGRKKSLILSCRWCVGP